MVSPDAPAPVTVSPSRASAARSSAPTPENFTSNQTTATGSVLVRYVWPVPRSPLASVSP